MNMTEQRIPQPSDRKFSVPGMCSASVIAGACALLLIGCEGATGPAGPAGATGSAGTGIVSNVEYIVQVTSGGSGAVVAVDPVTFQIKRGGTPDVGLDSTSSLNNTHKTMFYQGNRWVGGNGDVWAFDPETFAVVPRVTPVGQFIQANREGTVGPGKVNTKDATTAALASLPKDIAQYIGRSQLTAQEATEVNMCDVETLVKSSVTSTKAPSDTLAYSMGYSPVGWEETPDGNMGVAGVRKGDHMIFVDTNPASPTFTQPLRFIIERTGEIKDASNTVVATFPGMYTTAVAPGSTATAPGNIRYNESATSTGGETNPDTYVEPCDTTLLRAANGQLWFWTVDVDGDTITGARVDTITSATPTVVQLAVPHLDNAGGTGTGAFATVKRVGPWMASLTNRAADGKLLFSAENEGENSESLFDVTDPAAVVEVERIVMNLATINAPTAATQIGTLGTVGQFTNNQVIAVGVDLTTTGGTRQSVNYTYHALPGDDGSGAPPGLSLGNPPLTTAYLSKNTPTDPGPTYILNGLAGRGGTTEGNFVATVGTGSNTTVFSDKIWVETFVQSRLPAGCSGAGCFNWDIFQIVDLTTDILTGPWLVKENVNFPSAFGGMIGPDNKFVQVLNGQIQTIDVSQNPKVLKTVSLFDPTTGMPMTALTISLRYLPPLGGP
jgi:hypothetical protein